MNTILEQIAECTDSGREGELIYRLVYHKCGCRKPFRRLWISSMEDAAIREGYAQLIVQKKEAYKGYWETKREMQELLKTRQNVEQFYGDDLKKEREAARQQRKEL